MTPKTFLENFRHVINAPLGVSRLREMVYDLAISGSICTQSAEDGTGHELLEQIAKVKESRIQNGAFKRSPKLEGSSAKYSDSLPRIPGSWVWSRLVDLGEINPRNDADDEILATFAPMNAISELHNGPIRSEDRKWSSIKKGFTHFADGDVMVAKITPCFENGKGAILRGLTNGIGAGTTELHVVRPLPGVLPEFIYVFLRSPHFKSVGESHMTGTAGQKRLSTEYFALREFPLPPLEEQKRIVAKVDELMRLCDRLEAQQQEREKLLPLLSRAYHARFVAEPTTKSLKGVFQQHGTVSHGDMRETVLSLAVRGLLAEQHPEDDSVDELLSQIRKQRDEYGSSDVEEVSSAEEFFKIPKSWRWVRLGNISTHSDSGWSPQCKETPRVRNEWGILKVSAVSWGRFLPEENKGLPENVNPRSQCEVRDGDFLMSRANTFELVAKSVIVENPPPHLMLSDKIVRFHFPAEIDKEYINLFNLSPWARQYYAKNASGTSSSMKNVGRKVMTGLPIPFPPAKEQRRIVSRLRQFMSLIDRLEQQANEMRSTATSFAKAAVAAITSTEFKGNKSMKPPKTEVVTALKVGRKPKDSALAPLALQLEMVTSLPLPKHGPTGEANRDVTAKELWRFSGFEIDAFYRQLKTEMDNGWIAEDINKREILEVEAQ